MPYASGQGFLVTVPSGPVVEEHVPSVYMASKMAFAVESVEKLVPTTVEMFRVLQDRAAYEPEIKPVPR